MIHKFSRLLLTLVALFAMTAGAWAGEAPLLITIESTGDNASFKSGSKTFDDKVTVTFSGEGIGNDNDNWGWYTYSTSGITLTVTAAEGYTITGVKFYNNSGSASDVEAPFEAILVYDGGVVTKVNGTSIGQLGVTKIEVYGYATPKPQSYEAKVFNLPASWASDKTYISPADMPEDFAQITLDEAKALAIPDGTIALICGFNGEKVKVIVYNKNSGTYSYDSESKQSREDILFLQTYYNAKVCYTVIAPAIEVLPGSSANTWTFDMPASDVVLTPLYAPVAQWATESDVKLLPTAAEGIFAGTTDPIIVEGTVAPGQGTVMYAVTSTNQATAPELSAFSATVPTAENIADEGADVLVWYYIQGANAPDGQEATAENTFNDSEICATPLEVSVLSNQFDITFNAANANTIETGKATVTVGGTAATVTEGKLEGVKMGSEVKMTAKQGYKFRKVEAKKKALTLDLATVTTDITIEDGYTVIGMLGANVKISIANGATVTLDGVTINGVNNNSYKWAGINCLGDATIILSGTNTVKGFHENYPGIHVPQNKTLTIEGSGSLTASSNGSACGIGGGSGIACGNIVIAGGTITANGGMTAAGIGSGYYASCGTVTITDGVTSVTATGGYNSAGIGGGYGGSCGTISITGGTVTATASEYAAGIGSGYGGSCGNISITGGNITANGGSEAAGIGGGDDGSCGNITITNGVTSVTATKGYDANYSIGAGNNGSCGTVTVGGAEGQVSQSPYTYQPSN